MFAVHFQNAHVGGKKIYLKEASGGLTLETDRALGLYGTRLCYYFLLTKNNIVFNDGKVCVFFYLIFFFLP